MEVIKRDGRIVPFELDKIKNAIIKAFIEVDGDNINVEEVRNKAQNIAAQIFCVKKKQLSVEEIQDLVEEKLMASNRKDVARAYIRYRYKHNLARDKYSEMMDVVGEKLTAANVQNQNANVDERSFGGRVGEATNEVMRKYALDFCVSEKTKKNHLENRIYIHDLDHYAVGCHNCLTIPFDNLLKNGFNTRQVDIRPANSVNTAFQLVAVIFQLQSLMQFGGVSASHIDWTMVPYVRKSFWKHYLDGLMYIYEVVPVNFPNKPIEELSIEDSWYTAPEYDRAYAYAMHQTKKELQQAVEGMYHNLNSLQSRSGNQLPFTSINYGTCTSTEGRMVIKAILDGSIKGVGKLHRTSVFPCGIFQVGEGINKNPGDPNYDLFKLALKSTAQRLYPNYANYDVGMQKSWIELDRTQKQTVIDSLSVEEYDALIQKLEENPELKTILMLDIVEE